MSPRGTRADHYRSIAAFYGRRLMDDLHDPNVPDFVIEHDARRLAHYALGAIKLAEKPRRDPTSDSIPA